MVNSFINGVFMNTGEKIRKYRMEKNLSQVELSSILLVSRQTISNWENGRTRPEMENLVLISNFFDVPLEVFLSEDISEIKKQHTEFTFTAKIIFIIFISICVLISSIFMSIKMSKYFLVFPFLLLNIIFACLLTFFLRQTPEKSYLKKFNKLNFLFIILIMGLISFFSIYFLLTLLN